MSRKINIYQTVENVMRNWPHDYSDDAVAGLGHKDERGFIDCDELFYDDELDLIYEDEELFKNRIDEALNYNGLYLYLDSCSGNELCDCGVIIYEDFKIDFAKRYYGSWMTGRYCEILPEDTADAERLSEKFASLISFDIE